MKFFNQPSIYDGCDSFETHLRRGLRRDSRERRNYRAEKTEKVSLTVAQGLLV